MSKYYFGIDLGTTNSAISYINDTDKVSKIIELENGKTTLPSCVMLVNNNNKAEFVVGEEAYNNRYKPNAVYSVKSKMGTDSIINLNADGLAVRLTPEEVSSKIIKELVVNAEKVFGKGNIKDVVITVPAYFNQLQREATKKAGELAGLNVTKIINEPTSASLVYGIEKSDKSEDILVYDLGGGTFDVTVLKVSKNADKDDFSFLDLGLGGDELNSDTVVDILASDGDTHLGGDDIDKELYNILKAKVKLDYDYDLADLYKEECILSLEKVKKNFGGEVDVHIKGEVKKVYVSSSDIDKASEIVIDKTLTIVNKCIKDSGVRYVSKIVFVGGSTKGNLVKNRVKQEFPYTELLYGYKPDESVALGASIQAMADNVSDFVKVNDIVPLSIGLAVKDVKGNIVYNKIIKHGAKLPSVVSKVYTVKNKEKGVLNLDVYQGDSFMIEETVFLGRATFNVPDNIVDVEVEFLVDLNGILHCSLIYEDTKQEVELLNIFNSKKEDNLIEKFEYDKDSNTDNKAKNESIERKKYARWKKVLINKGATAEDLAEFEKAFKKGAGKTFVNYFKKDAIEKL